jgi:hypothetical protein
MTGDCLSREARPPAAQGPYLHVRGNLGKKKPLFAAKEKYRAKSSAVEMKQQVQDHPFDPARIQAGQAKGDTSHECSLSLRSVSLFLETTY